VEKKKKRLVFVFVVGIAGGSCYRRWRFAKEFSSLSIVWWIMGATILSGG